jgi:hypothetical protein
MATNAISKINVFKILMGEKKVKINKLLANGRINYHIFQKGLFYYLQNFENIISLITKRRG